MERGLLRGAEKTIADVHCPTLWSLQLSPHFQLIFPHF